MRLLLDTHVVLWSAIWPERLSSEAADLLSQDNNELLFSVINVWEVAIKLGLNRPDFQVDPQRLLQNLLANGYVELPVNGRHAVAVASLPPIHRDPFDRMLIAQCIVEGATLLTADPVLMRYPAPVRLVTA